MHKAIVPVSIHRVGLLCLVSVWIIGGVWKDFSSFPGFWACLTDSQLEEMDGWDQADQGRTWHYLKRSTSVLDLGLGCFVPFLVKYGRFGVGRGSKAVEDIHGWRWAWLEVSGWRCDGGEVEGRRMYRKKRQDFHFLLKQNLCKHVFSSYLLEE